MWPANCKSLPDPLQGGESTEKHYCLAKENYLIIKIDYTALQFIGIAHLFVYKYFAVLKLI